MLLEQIVEIIELTDTDSISEALDTFNQCGIVSSAAFPFLHVIFERAPKLLCTKLKQVGFKGMVEIAKINTDGVGNCYAVYDALRYSKSEAKSWLEIEFSHA